MADIECPYCGHGFDICNDDGHGVDEGVCHQEECPSCLKNFVFTTRITLDYTAYKADCLNDREHDWQRTNTIPRKYARMRCSMCDEERNLTEDEWKALESEESNA